MMNSAFTLLHKSTANTLYRCIDFLEARGRPGNHSNNYWLLKTRDRFPDESEWLLFYREPTTCRVILSSSLHASPLVFPVELATESVNLESSCGLEILIIRALLQVVSQLPETADTLSLQSLRKSCSIKMMESPQTHLICNREVWVKISHPSHSIGGKYRSAWLGFITAISLLRVFTLSN